MLFMRLQSILGGEVVDTEAAPIWPAWLGWGHRRGAWLHPLLWPRRRRARQIRNMTADEVERVRCEATENYSDLMVEIVAEERYPLSCRGLVWISSDVMGERYDQMAGPLFENPEGSPPPSPCSRTRLSAT